MANGLMEGTTGGITYNSGAFSFGNTVPAPNSGFSFDLPMATIQAFSNQALSFTSNNSARNTAFLGQVISTAQGGVDRMGDRVFGYQQDALNLFGQISRQAQHSVNEAVKTRRRGCFITTAICQADGKADDCEDLQKLRKFRDEVMARDETMSAYVAPYYQAAPEVVERINERDDAESIYHLLKIAYLQPAIVKIDEGEYWQAFDLYVELCRVAAIFALEK